MDRNTIFLLTCLLSLFVAGCNSQQSSNPITPSAPEASTPILTTGSWSGGPEYERVQGILDNADAKIRLDVHQGIECYDGDSEAWEGLDSIELIKGHLEKVPDKTLISIGTGKAIWDKESEYVQIISDYAKQLDFDTIVVTTDHSSALVISEVIQLKR